MAPAKTWQNESYLVCSPAKINLFLEILGRRADGFHDLETVMVRTDLCDTLRFEGRDDESIKISLVGNRNFCGTGSTNGSAGFPLDHTNLIVRAAEALRNYAGISRGATIRVHKRIPSQAGLAGGSGNAATTLRVLNRLWKLHLPASTLHDIAATLGSDVNFLLSGYRAAICRGRGERISPIRLTTRHNGLLIAPDSGNATAEVFRALKVPQDYHSATKLISLLSNGEVRSIPTHCFNRLQPVATQLNRDVRATLQWLVAHAGNGLMTGSGSGCFALLRSAAEARRLSRQFGNCGSFVTSFQY
ncbi:MAG: 4-(cytidine 5'-diphospho)-2-C-methyl-D-erythritol kinase [Fuerstiella sp.]|nr:4-(cytidine 5'-diphospho)-2-C-methyl-D-erythritol kinase [Fuerstiella sp.]